MRYSSEVWSSPAEREWDQQQRALKRALPCRECGSTPTSHSVWTRTLGQEQWCCRCYVNAGHPPADWHPACMETYAERKAERV